MDSKGSKFNARSPAVKRILQEIKEIHDNSTPDFIAEALEDDIFEWHFVIRGPPDSEFEGGIYHGRILLPAEYPFKPPSFMMLTPSGRFQTNTKICLSISSHHPEHWQPSWSVRTALTAMIAFMPTPGQGALGSLDFPKEERKVLAQKSRIDIPKFGAAERQKLIEEMHQRMLDLENTMASTSSSSSKAAATTVDTTNKSSPASTPTHNCTQPGCTHTCTMHTTHTASAPAQHAAANTTTATAPVAAAPGPQVTMRRDSTDTGLTLLAVALSLAIAAILIRKVLTAMGSSNLYGI